MSSNKDNLRQNRFFPLALALGALASCAIPGNSSKSAAVVKTCSIPTDQQGTISGQWPVIPIPLAMSQGGFDSTELSAITSAVTTWNDFFGASKNLKTLDMGSNGSTRTSTATNPAQGGNLCIQGSILQANRFIGNVVIYKMAQWPPNYPKTAIALTSFCFLPGSPYPKLHAAVMEVNYQHFFSEGTKVPDLQSITLHELGHLHGLNHSCAGTTVAGTPNCNDPNIDSTYLSAAMYPVFNFNESGQGELKRSLGTNDQSRANCLYSAP